LTQGVCVGSIRLNAAAAAADDDDDKALQISTTRNRKVSVP
jgi:hypothetical protein